MQNDKTEHNRPPIHYHNLPHVSGVALVRDKTDFDLDSLTEEFDLDGREEIISLKIATHPTMRIKPDSGIGAVVGATQTFMLVKNHLGVMKCLWLVRYEIEFQNTYSRPHVEIKMNAEARHNDGVLDFWNGFAKHEWKCHEYVTNSVRRELTVDVFDQINQAYLYRSAGEYRFC